MAGVRLGPGGSMIAWDPRPSWAGGSIYGDWRRWWTKTGLVIYVLVKRGAIAYAYAPGYPELTYGSI